MGKTYAFDATAQGKGLWKEVTKAGKLGRIASNDLQKRWGNPNESGPLYETPKTNVDKMGNTIRDSVPKTERLKSFRSLLKDPNENVKSAAFKSIKQNLRPEMIMKQIFGKTVGMMTAKGLGVSPERMDAVSRGFAGANERRSNRRSNKASETAPSYTSSYGSSELNSYLKSMTEELKKIREKLYGENTIAVKFSKSSDTYKQLEDVAEFANEEKKRKDLEENFKNIPQKQGMPFGTPTAVPAEGMSQTGGGGSGISSLLESMFGGILGGAAGIGLAGLGKKLLSVVGKAFLGLAKKLPIIGPIIMAAMGLKDAYDEYMAGGDFSDAVGAFFESVADSLTFGLSTSLTGQGGIKKFVSGMVDKGKDFFEDAMDTLGDMLQDYLIDPIVNMPTKLLNSIKGVIGNILESVGNVSLEIPEITIIPETRFTPKVSVGPYKISPFSGLAETGKSLKQSAAAGQAEMDAADAQKQETRAARDAQKQETRAARDAAKEERAAEEAKKAAGGTAVPQAAPQPGGGTATQVSPTPIPGTTPTAIPAGQQSVDENLVRMRQALAEQGITDPNIVNATLANIMKETGGRNISENMNYANSSNDRLRQVFGSRASKFSDAELDEIKKDPQKLGEMMYGASTEMGRRMGNTEEGEGYKFRGRGFVQLTGKNNYAKASQALFGDDRLVQNPDLLNDPDIAAKTSAWYMKDTQAGAARMMGLDPSKLTAQQAQDLTTSQIAGVDITKSRNTHIQELRRQVGQYSNDPRVQTAMGATLPTAQTQMASSDLVPEQRKTGDAIDQTATQLAETQMAAATPPASSPVINNVTNNNVSGGGGGQSQPAAPVRNEENSLMKAQMDAALLAMS